jgi:hypothetical protein
MPALALTGLLAAMMKSDKERLASSPHRTAWLLARIRGGARRQPVLREIDTRRIPGNAGKVTLWVDFDRPNAGVIAEVWSPAGIKVTRLQGLTRAEAVQVYLHPFADHRAPNSGEALAA